MVLLNQRGENMNIENLKYIRKAMNMTQTEAANALNISPNTYRNYEQGTREPNNDTLIKLAKFYGVTTDYLLGIEPAPNQLANLNVNIKINDKKFIKLYSELPEYVKKIFIDTMARLAQSAEQDSCK